MFGKGAGVMKRVIKDKGKAKRRIGQKGIAKALGAVVTGVKIDTRRGPVSLITLRQFLANRLYSTGGRPRLRGTRNKRSKISLFDEDWKKLEEICRYYREEEGINVSPGQIASVLIHAEVSRMKPSKMKPRLHSDSD